MIDLLIICIVAVAGYYCAQFLIHEIDLKEAASPILSLCAVLALMTVPTVQLIMKLHELGGHSSLSSSEHSRLGDIVENKSRLLKVFLLYIVFCAFVVVIAAFLAKTDGVIAEYILTIATMMVFICLYLFVHVVRGFDELRKFKWHLEQKIIDSNKRKETLIKLNQSDQP